MLCDVFVNSVVPIVTISILNLSTRSLKDIWEVELRKRKRIHKDKLYAPIFIGVSVYVHILLQKLPWTYVKLQILPLIWSGQKKCYYARHKQITEIKQNVNKKDISITKI